MNNNNTSYLFSYIGSFQSLVATVHTITSGFLAIVFLCCFIAYAHVVQYSSVWLYLLSIMSFLLPLCHCFWMRSQKWPVLFYKCFAKYRWLTCYWNQVELLWKVFACEKKSEFRDWYLSCYQFVSPVTTRSLLLPPGPSCYHVYFLIFLPLTLEIFW